MEEIQSVGFDHRDTGPLWYALCSVQKLDYFVEEWQKIEITRKENL